MGGRGGRTEGRGGGAAGGCHLISVRSSLGEGERGILSSEAGRTHTLADRLIGPTQLGSCTALAFLSVAEVGARESCCGDTRYIRRWTRYVT